MIWNITSFSDNQALLQISTYTYNTTSGKVNIFSAGDFWKVDSDTRLIVQSSTGVTGYKNPFWIDTNVNVGSTIDAYFGATAQIQQPESIAVLGRTVNCWKISLDWPTSTMKRWYDPATGIVLRIDTTRAQAGTNMAVAEVAVASNITLIGTQSPPSGNIYGEWPFIAGIAVIVAGLAVASLVYVRRRRIKAGAI